MNSIKVLKNIVYGKTDLEYLTADVYLPINMKNIPILLLIHGGAFQAGSKEMYENWGPFLAENGYCAVAINYRLAGANYSTYPGVIYDVSEAMNFLVSKANEWNLDPMNVSLIGDSAGAYLSTMLALKSGISSYKVKLIVSVYGVFDIVEWENYTNKTRADFVVNKFFGSTDFLSHDLYQAANPIVQIEKVLNRPNFDVEFLLIYGEKDDVVDPENQTLAFAKKLDTLNIMYSIASISDYGHFWFTKNGNQISESNDGDLDQYPINKIKPILINKLSTRLRETYTHQVLQKE